MTAHAGEAARKTGDFVCDKCGATARLTRDEHIPKGPHSGNHRFGERRNEPCNPSAR